jgi:hypothetical protein
VSKQGASWGVSSQGKAAVECAGLAVRDGAERRGRARKDRGLLGTAKWRDETPARWDRGDEGQRRIERKVSCNWPWPCRPLLARRCVARRAQNTRSAARRSWTHPCPHTQTRSSSGSHARVHRVGSLDSRCPGSIVETLPGGFPTPVRASLLSTAPRRRPRHTVSMARSIGPDAHTSHTSLADIVAAQFPHVLDPNLIRSTLGLESPPTPMPRRLLGAQRAC